MVARDTNPTNASWIGQQMLIMWQTKGKSQFGRGYSSLAKHCLAQANYFFTRLPRQKLPSHTDLTLINLHYSSRGRTHLQNIANQNTHTQEIPLVAKVQIHNHKIKKWDWQATILEIRQDGWSSLLETANNTHLLRGRRFVELC